MPSDLIWNAAEIEKKVEDQLQQNIVRAAIHLKNAMQATLNVQAPRRLSGRRWVATTAASPGAPPRRVSGFGRGSVSFRIDVPGRKASLVAVGYLVRLETRGHPWIQPTLEKEAGALAKLMAGESLLSGEK